MVLFSLVHTPFFKEILEIKDLKDLIEIVVQRQLTKLIDVLLQRSISKFKQLTKNVFKWLIEAGEFKTILRTVYLGKIYYPNLRNLRN